MGAGQIRRESQAALRTTAAFKVVAMAWIDSESRMTFAVRFTSLMAFGAASVGPGKTQLQRTRGQGQGDFEQVSDFRHSHFGQTGFRTPFFWIRLWPLRNTFQGYSASGDPGRCQQRRVRRRIGEKVGAVMRLGQRMRRRIDIPLRIVQQSLRPNRTLVAHRFRQLPAILPFHLRQQHLQIYRPLLLYLYASNQRGKPTVKRLKTVRPIVQINSFHSSSSPACTLTSWLEAPILNNSQL